MTYAEAMDLTRRGHHVRRAIWHPTAWCCYIERGLRSPAEVLFRDHVPHGPIMVEGHMVRFDGETGSYEPGWRPKDEDRGAKDWQPWPEPAAA